MKEKRNSTKTKAQQKSTQVLQELTETQVTPDERLEMISEAAYYRAEQRGFDPEGSHQDWIEAENIIDRILNKEVEEVAEHA